jgi:hypothetical protein
MYMYTYLTVKTLKLAPFGPSFWNGWDHKLQIQYQPSFCVKKLYVKIL